MTSTRKAYFVGGGIGSLAGAGFLIREGGVPAGQISILEAGPVMGGSLDGAGDAGRGDSMRGGCRLTTDNCGRTRDLFKSIPSLAQPGRSVFDETLEFNERHVSNAMARPVDSRPAKVPVSSMGFSMRDRLQLLKLANADESTLCTSCITDYLSPAFFQTGCFANQPADVQVFWAPPDTVFTVAEFSVRAAQIAVYQLLGITKAIPPVTPHDKSLRAQFEALVKALK